MKLTRLRCIAHQNVRKPGKTRLGSPLYSSPASLVQVLHIQILCVKTVVTTHIQMDHSHHVNHTQSTYSPLILKEINTACNL